MRVIHVEAGEMSIIANKAAWVAVLRFKHKHTTIPIKKKNPDILKAPKRKGKSVSA